MPRARPRFPSGIRAFTEGSVFAAPIVGQQQSDPDAKVPLWRWWFGLHSTTYDLYIYVGNHMLISCKCLGKLSNITVSIFLVVYSSRLFFWPSDLCPEITESPIVGITARPLHETAENLKGSILNMPCKILFPGS